MYRITITVWNKAGILLNIYRGFVESSKRLDALDKADAWGRATGHLVCISAILV